MSKNIVNWFAVMVLAGVLSACGQNQGTDQGADKGATGTEQPAQQPAAPAGGEKPAGQ